MKKINGAGKSMSKLNKKPKIAFISNEDIVNSIKENQIENVLDEEMIEQLSSVKMFGTDPEIDRLRARINERKKKIQQLREHLASDGGAEQTREAEGTGLAFISVYSKKVYAPGVVKARPIFQTTIVNKSI